MTNHGPTFLKRKEKSDLVGLSNTTSSHEAEEVTQPETTGSSLQSAALPLDDAPLPGINQQGIDQQVGSPAILHSASLMFFFRVCQSGETSMEDPHQSLAERRTRREHRKLPKRYRDIAPVPPAPLPPPSLQVTPDSNTLQPPSQQCPAPSSLVRNTLKSTCNVFGLF